MHPQPLSPPRPSANAYPFIQVIPLALPLRWIALGWRDMLDCGWVSFAHGLVLTMIGAAILALAHDRFWLLAGAFSGFMLVAPVLASSLYALSRARERGEKADFQVVLKTWLNWQNKHFKKWDNDYWCLVQFGALLALAGTGWVITSASLITLLAPAPIAGLADFLRYVVLYPDGFLFSLWLALGGVLAAPIFASSVVAVPLLLDRRVSLPQAVQISWLSVLANPLPMALWAAVIMLLTFLSMAAGLIGLILTMPLLGHASWHAYRALVNASAFPERISPE
jgi:uncharacterized membrane protein